METKSRGRTLKCQCVLIATATSAQNIEINISAVKSAVSKMVMNGPRSVERMLIKENEDLKDYIDNICGIIEAEMPLKEQDLWLEDMKQRDLYKSEKCEQ
jgi:hypothetical protein